MMRTLSTRMSTNFQMALYIEVSTEIFYLFMSDLNIG
jgi:hypothetical protein